MKTDLAERRETIVNLVPSPFLVTRKQLYEMYSSPRLLQRMIAARWIETVRGGKSGRETLFDYESAQRAYQRLKTGEEPPLLPSETRQRKSK